MASTNKKMDEEMKVAEDMALTGMYNYIGYQHVQNTANQLDEISMKCKDIDYPKALDEWFENYLHTSLKQEKQKKRYAAFRRYSNRAAIFLLLIIAGIAVTTLKVEAFRVKFLNLFIEVNERYSQVKIKDINEDNVYESIPADWEEYYLPEYIPDYFEIYNIKTFGDSKMVYYKDSKGNEIQFSQSPISDTFQIDTEDGIMVNVQIEGNQGILVDKNGLLTLIWYDENSTFYIIGKIDKNDMIKMAESMKKQE